MLENKNICPMAVAMEKIGGKWKLHLLYFIFQGVHRPSDLQRKIPNLSPRVLSRQLQELLEDGLLTRQIHAVVPPKVEYFLSDFGQSLEKILTEMDLWGQAYLDHFSKA